jgi:hypothetical protein
MIYQPNADVTRTVFVGTPLRGSDDATGVRGSIGSKLIKYPVEQVSAGLAQSVIAGIG